MMMNFQQVRIGWKPVQMPEAKEYVIKSFTVPAGTWVCWLPVRVRWDPRQTISGGITIRWKEPVTPTPTSWSFSDHVDIETGAAGEADSMYVLSCGITCTQPTPLTATLTTTGPYICSLVDGDGLRFGEPA